MTQQNVVKRNGHFEDEEIEETPEDLDNAFNYMVINDTPRGAGGFSPVTFAKQDMSLMQKILAVGDEDYRREAIWRMMNFIDEEEALDHVAAYYEARDLGMDTSFNVAFAYSLVSTNRKTSQTSLISILLDTLQHGKWAGNTNQRKSGSNANSRSPLS